MENQKTKKRAAIVAVLVLALAGALAMGVFAILSHSTQRVTNTFSSSPLLLNPTAVVDPDAPVDCNPAFWMGEHQAIKDGTYNYVRNTGTNKMTMMNSYAGLHKSEDLADPDKTYTLFKDAQVYIDLNKGVSCYIYLQADDENTEKYLADTVFVNGDWAKLGTLDNVYVYKGKVNSDYDVAIPMTEDPAIYQSTDTDPSTGEPIWKAITQEMVDDWDSQDSQIKDTARGAFINANTHEITTFGNEYAVALNKHIVLPTTTLTVTDQTLPDPGDEDFVEGVLNFRAYVAQSLGANTEIQSWNAAGFNNK